MVQVMFTGAFVTVAVIRTVPPSPPPGGMYNAAGFAGLKLIPPGQSEHWMGVWAKLIVTL
jgi:hypothetical protein